MEKELSKMSLEELWELFPIVLKEHETAYKDQYLKEKEKIIKNVGGIHVERISHIGSTVVKDLISKPIVDILLEIDKECNIEKLKERLTNSGWLLMAIDKKPDIMSFFTIIVPALSPTLYQPHLSINNKS